MSRSEAEELRRALEVMVESAFWRLCFFDLVDEDVLDLDVSVAQQEDIAQALRSGGPAVRELFVRIARRVARDDSRPPVREWASVAPGAVWDGDELT